MPQKRSVDPTRESDAMRQIVGRLRRQFPELPPERIDDAVYGHYNEFDGHPIRDFVPIFVERDARRDLHDVPPARDIPNGAGAA